MKLWQKLSLTMVLVSLLVTGTMGAAMSWYSAHYNEEKTVESYERRVESVALALAAELSGSGVESYSEVTRNSYLDFLLRKYGANQFMLLRGDEVVGNLTPFELADPGQDRFLDNEVESVIQKRGNQYVLVMGRTVLVDGYQRYRLILAQDISEVYADIRNQAFWFAMLCLAGILVMVIFVFFFTKRMLKPLQSLKTAAEQIRSGRLEYRAEVKTEDEIGVVTDAFNEMAAKIEAQIMELSALSEQRRQMLGSMAHELKTPMTSIVGYTDTLLHVNVKEEQRERALWHIYEESRRLERLGSKLMSLIGMYDNESICLEKTDMAALFARVGEAEGLSLAQRGMRLQISCRMKEKKVDRDLLESLLVNLIDNAAKASEEGAVIYLEGEGNRISVRDQGCGIPKEEIGRVTEAFYMVDRARSRKAGGCGLGLSLCCQIARLHQAQLVIGSEVGKGTTVSVLWPDEDGDFSGTEV